MAALFDDEDERDLLLDEEWVRTAIAGGQVLPSSDHCYDWMNSLVLEGEQTIANLDIVSFFSKHVIAGQICRQLAAFPDACVPDDHTWEVIMDPNLLSDGPAGARG